jgi:cell division protein FtsI/penicillin-binding protein 2
MMVGVIEDAHGTGKAAAIPGVLVGGKTGTAQKARKNGRGYEPGAYVASFAGFVEGQNIGVNRNLSLVIMIDEPRGGVIYGGALAAPVFKKVMVRTLNYLATRSKLKGFQQVRFES